MNIIFTMLMVAVIVTVIYFIGSCIKWQMIDLDDIAPSVLAGVLCGLISVLPILLYALVAEGELYKNKTYEISALKDKSNISGRSFIGTGYINEDQYYFYIIETSKGKKMDKVHINKAYLNEGNYTPHVDVYNFKYKDEFAQWLIGYDKHTEYEYVFFIPENTVTTEFNVDME